MAKHCHEALKKIAEEMAGCVYEEAAHNDMFYKIYPDQKSFIAANWPKFVNDARVSLVTMLSGKYPDQVKLDIEEILTLDRSIPASQRL